MPSKSYQIQDLIKVGKTIDLTHYNSSIHDNIYDISYTVSNIMYDYINELLEISAEITLTDVEYNMYKYNPKSLSYKLYGSTDLFFILLILNDLTSYKDFDLKTIKVIHPKSLYVLYEILDTEKIYLNKSTVRMTSPSNKIYNVSSYGGKDEYLEKILKDLQDQIDSIKGSIMDAIEAIVGKDLDKIIENIVNVEMNEIRNSIETIINNNLTNIHNKIAQLEQSINNIKNLIDTLIDGKINSKLESIIKRIDALENSIPDKLKEILKEMKDDIESLLPNLDTIISDRFKEFIANLDKDMGMINGGMQSRDIGFNMYGPLKTGIQPDTEMLIPYKGKIINGTLSTPINNYKVSNIIAVLHIWDKGKKDWVEAYKFNLHRDKYIDRFILNVPINDQPIRLSIESGILDKVESLQLILSISEDYDSNRKEGIITPGKVIKNGMNLYRIPIDKNVYKGMIDVDDKIQPNLDPAKYMLEVDGIIYSVSSGSIVIVEEFSESNFNKFGVDRIKELDQKTRYITPTFKNKFDFNVGGIYISEIDKGDAQ